jgi:hypothetical protein
MSDTTAHILLLFSPFLESRKAPLFCLWCYLFRYVLADDKLSESQKEARRLLLEISDYILFDGVLYHSRVAKSKRAKLMSPYQLVLPETLVPKVLKLTR